MEERREVLLPDQKQHKEDDGKKKLGEGEKRSLALEKKLHTKTKTEKKERRKENLTPQERELNRTKKMI